MQLGARRRTRRNYRALTGALLLAIALWIYVKLTTTYDYRLTVPIVLSHMREGRALSEAIPPAAIVRVSGRGTTLTAMLTMRRSDLWFEIDLSTINSFWDCPANNYLGWIHLPPGYDDLVLHEVIRPDTIRIRLTARGTRDVAVHPGHFDLDTEAGYVIVGGVRFTPNAIRVTGAGDLVDALDSLRTGPVQLRDLDGPRSGTAGLVPPADRLLTLTPEAVTYHIDVQRLGEVVVPGVPIVVEGVPAPATAAVQPQTVDLTIHGGVEYIRQLTPEDFIVSVAFQATWQRYREYRAPIHVQHPPDAVPADGNVRTVTVIVR